MFLNVQIISPGERFTNRKGCSTKRFRFDQENTIYEHIRDYIN